MAPHNSTDKQVVVLITGCSHGGIGYSLVQQFHACGCRVFATARRLSAMEGLRELTGVTLLQLDVTDPASIQAAVGAVVSTAGRLDILVNNAGVVVLGPSAEVPMSAARQCFDVNVMALLEMCQAVVPVMAAQGGGKIINIGSLTGFTPVPLRGIYSASKGAVLRLSDALRLELRPLGVQVMLAAPGFINTHARDTAQDLALTYSSTGSTGHSLWTGWLDVLQLAMRKLVREAVPAGQYAQQMVAVALRKKLPRYWVGPCAGIEWLLRWLPLPLQEFLLVRAMGLRQLDQVLQHNAAALRHKPDAAAGAAAGKGLQ